MTMWQCSLILVGAVFLASANEDTPLGKVVELLSKLEATIDEEGTKDGTVFSESQKFFMKQVDEATKTIKETKITISGLKSDLEEQEAFREQATANLEKTIGEVTKNEKDLKDAKMIREKEHKEYMKNEEGFSQALDQLERALDVMARTTPADAPAADAAAPLMGGSLVDVAHKLRKTLRETTDFSLSPLQVDTLDSFVHLAEDRQEQERDNGAQANFLQTNLRRAPGDYGDYEKQGGGVTTIMQNLKAQTEKERDDAMKTEAKAKQAFETMEPPMTKQIETGKATMVDLKVQISSSQETTGQKTADLNNAQELLQTTVDKLAELNAMNHRVVHDYQSRTAKRSDELIACQEASRILTSEAAKRFQKKQSIGEVEDDAAQAPASFLQLSQASAPVWPTGEILDSIQAAQNSRRTALKLVRGAKTPGLVLLAMKSQTHLASSTRQDPFAKVKRMVQQMLEKLMQEQADEAQHKEWCDVEMSRSLASKQQKEQETAKLQNRIDAIDAELESLAAETAELTSDINFMQQSIVEASEMRDAERVKNEAAMKDYADAQDLVNSALTLLKGFYQDLDNAKEKHGGYQVQEGGGKGVIGILEIALQDFEDLEKEVALAESTAQKDFEDLTHETNLKKATFSTTLSYKQRKETKLKSERARASADLKGYEKELASVNDYLAKLKPSCTIQGDSYEERQRRREAELQSLQEALQVLEGEAIA